MIRSSSEKKQQVCVRMPIDLVEQIDGMAESEHRDRSSMIIHILSVYVTERKRESEKPKKTPPLVKVGEGWVD